jgi:hypothetical protein
MGQQQQALVRARDMKVQGSMSQVMTNAPSGWMLCSSVGLRSMMNVSAGLGLQYPRSARS